MSKKTLGQTAFEAFWGSAPKTWESIGQLQDSWECAAQAVVDALFNKVTELAIEQMQRSSDELKKLGADEERERLANVLEKTADEYEYPGCDGPEARSIAAWIREGGKL